MWYLQGLVSLTHYSVGKNPAGLHIYLSRQDRYEAALRWTCLLYTNYWTKFFSRINLLNLTDKKYKPVSRLAWYTYRFSFASGPFLIFIHVFLACKEFGFPLYCAADVSGKCSGGQLTFSLPLADRMGCMKSTLCEGLARGLERKNSPQTVGAEQRPYVRDPTFEAKDNRVSRHTVCWLRAQKSRSWGKRSIYKSLTLALL